MKASAVNSKEKIETKHVKSFLEKLLPNFKGEIVKQKPPEPDFYIEMPDHLIGIEHTRLIHPKDQRNVDPRAHSAEANKILKGAESIYNKSSNIKLNVHVDFRLDYGSSGINKTVGLSKKDRAPLSKFIAEFVKNNIPAPKTIKVFDALNPKLSKTEFPKKIRRIIVKNPSRNDSCWNPIEGGTISPLYSSPAFVARISEKNSKPINYLKSYDQIWLLMVENHIEFTSSFDFEYQDIPEIDSPFNRIFIYRFGYSEIIEINNSRLDNDRWPNKKA